MAKVTGLSHVGLYVKDLEKMTAFYRDVLGMTVSHQNADRMAFLTADQKREDHEIALMKGRDGDAKIVQQLAFHTGSVEDVRAFYELFKRTGVAIDHAVSHGNTVSCYFFDPEGNRCEVFALVEVDPEQGYRGPLDLEKSAEELLAQVTAGADIPARR